MFRSALKLKTISKLSKRNRNQSLRSYSSDADKSNSGKVGLIVGSSVVVLSGLTIGYAKYDSDFRKKVENWVPFSDKLFNSLFGQLVQTKSLNQNNPSINKPKEEKIESFMNKKKERKEVSEPLNQNNNKIDIKNGEIKDNKNNSQQIPQTNEEKTETEGKETPNESETEEKSDVFKDALLDIDVLIARDALTDQLLELLPHDDQRVKELQKRANDIELEYQRKITKLEENFESELKTQLKRQLSAFNEHLEDQKSNLKIRLKRDYDNALEEKLLDEKIRFQSELANSFFRLQVLEDFIKAREQLDSDQHSVRELWVLCQALKEALNHKPSMNEDSSPLQLKQELTAVQLILNKNSLKDKPLTRLALESIPKEVLENGVYSEEDLTKRFEKVDKYCKRVALIGDEGGSLYLYILSFIQSVLVFRDSKIPKEELEDKEVDPSKWDTFDILTRIRYSLNNHNLEMALKYANQLKGEARNVAKDWIRDTRTHLEVKQAFTLLQTEADAINAQIIN